MISTTNDHHRDFGTMRFSKLYSDCVSYSPPGRVFGVRNGTTSLEQSGSSICCSLDPAATQYTACCRDTV